MSESRIITTKTKSGVAYDLVATKYEGADMTILDCNQCVAFADRELCLSLGTDCIGKGIWKEATK